MSLTQASRANCGDCQRRVDSKNLRANYTIVLVLKHAHSKEVSNSRVVF